MTKIVLLDFHLSKTIEKNVYIKTTLEYYAKIIDVKEDETEEIICRADPI